MLSIGCSKPLTNLTNLFLGEFSRPLTVTPCSTLRMLAGPVIISARNDRAFRAGIGPMTLFPIHIVKIVKLRTEK